MRQQEQTEPPPAWPPDGYLEYQARTAFRDLVRVYGFEEARAIMAEIINSESQR